MHSLAASLSRTALQLRREQLCMHVQHCGAVQSAMEGGHGQSSSVKSSAVTPAVSIYYLSVGLLSASKKRGKK